MANEIEILQVESQPEYQSDYSVIAKVSADKLSSIGTKCKNRLDDLKTGRRSSKYEEDRQLDFDAYHLVPPKKPLPYQGYPNLVCPLARIGIDTFHSNVMFTFGGQSGVFKVLPEFLSSSHMDVARRAAEYMTYCLNYEAGFYDALDKASMDSNKYDNGFLEPRYIIQYEYQTKLTESETIVSITDPVTGQVTKKPKKTKKTKRKKVKVFDGVKVERIDPVMVYASPLFESIEEAAEKDFVFKVANYSMRFLKENSITPDDEDESYFDPKQVEKVKAVKRAEIISQRERNKQDYDGVMVDSEMEITPIELATAYFREDMNNDKIAEHVIVVFESATGIVLRITYGKCRIVKITPRPVDGRWSGESIRKVLNSYTIEWEAIHNQRVAKGQWSNLPFFFYKAGGRFNPQIVTLMPGKGYPMDDPNSVNFPQPPPPDQSYYREEQLIMDLVDRILGLGDVIQGVQKGGETATNTIQSVQRAGIRLSNPINRVGMSLEKLIGHIWELNKQCAPQEKEYRVVGTGDGVPVFNKITSEDYETMVSFKLNMATMYDVQMVRDTALLNYRTFISNPIFMSNPASFYQLTQQTMDAVGLKIKLPVPPQAKAKSGFEIVDLIHQGENEEPQIGIDPDDHMRIVMSVMQDEDFKDWPQDRRVALMSYYDKCQILKQTLEKANLNQSGVFEGMNGVQPPQTPGMTATRNPSQTFNNLRIGNTSKSAAKQPANGMAGAMAPQPNQGGM